MQNPPPTVLDRRVTVTTASNERLPVERVSELGGYRYVVLLGEPGIGKSTVLEQRADAIGAAFTTVRDFLAGPITATTAICLDSLDEYRSNSGSAIEKLWRGIAASGAATWWLSCRAEDWRDADLSLLAKAAIGAPLVVATLEPLEQQEADQILAAIGTAHGWVGAGTTAARPFLQNPLALTLLARTSSPDGPMSRFALFKDATFALAHEFDDRSRGRPVRDPAAICETASRMCALLLLSNRVAVWHHNRPVPSQGDARRYLAVNSLILTPELVRQALDTALFRRRAEGTFMPMHRAVAEFLAGSALADAVAGARHRPRYPLGRALALIAPSDRPPTDLRGVYGWTAVHLSRRGLHEEARQMIAQDPISVLLYGDAAALSRDERLELWHQLDRDDPWFLANHDGDTAIGGLAGDDLAEQFARALREPDGKTHRFIAVTDALRFGIPVPGLRPVLWEVALDPERAEHERVRAAEAWVAGEPDSVAARLSLFRACCGLPGCDGHVHFRRRMAGELPGNALSDAELEQLLVDHARTKQDHVVGTLWKLSRQLEAWPRPSLLQRDWHALLKPSALLGQTGDVERLLDSIMVQALAASPVPSGKVVWQWLKSISAYPLAPVRAPLQSALQLWLGGDPVRGIDLLASIAESEKDGADGWPSFVFATKCGVFPSVGVASALVDPSSGICAQVGVERCRDMAIALAMQTRAEPAVRAAVRTGLRALPRTVDTDRAIAILDRGPVHDSVVAEHDQRDAAYRAEMVRRERKVVGKFHRTEASLRDGSAKALLQLAARYHFGTDLHGNSITPAFDRVSELVGPDLAKSVEEGWIRSAMTISLDPAELGRLEALHQQHPAEWSVLAGIDRMLEFNPAAASELPLSAALVALKSGWEVCNGGGRSAADRLWLWALERLAAAGTGGSKALAGFWQAALAAKARNALPASWLLSEHAQQGQFAAPALRDVLCSHPHMPSNVLGGLLAGAARILSLPDFHSLAAAALRNPAVMDDGRDLWLCVAFASSPGEHQREFVTAFSGRAGELNEHYDLIDRLAERHITQRILIALGVLQVCGRAANREGYYRIGKAPRECLDYLQRSPDPLARIALNLLASDPALVILRDDFRHALAQQARQVDDASFAARTPQEIEDAMAGGAPLNAADLFAVLVEELRQIQAEIQTASLSPWAGYWNEKPKTPKTENRCRDELARTLQARLRRFGIVIPLAPEAQRAAETRADLVVTSSTGKNVPMEAKRHWHPRVWDAAATQLQGYAADVGADGFGIYLVFWFGAAHMAVPARADRRTPATAVEMEHLLRDDLPETLRRRTAIVVLDVSDPRQGRRTSWRKTTQSQ